MTCTPEWLTEARERLGMTYNQLAFAVGLDSDAVRADGKPVGWKKAGSRIREMETGRRQISGPIRVAVEAMLTGWRPSHWED